MNAALIRLVWQRADSRYEYCQMPQAADDASFEIDHMAPNTLRELPASLKPLNS